MVGGRLNSVLVDRREVREQRQKSFACRLPKMENTPGDYSLDDTPAQRTPDRDHIARVPDHTPHKPIPTFASACARLQRSRCHAPHNADAAPASGNDARPHRQMASVPHLARIGV